MRKVDEQELRSYLLGSLAPERQAELHARLEEDADLNDELLAVEAEIFDQYVAGLLVGDEKQLFETNVLTAAGAADKLRFAENFSRVRDVHKSQAPTAVHRAPAPNTLFVPTSAPLFATFGRRPVFAVLLIILAGLLVTLLAWSFLLKTPANNLARQSSPAVVEITLAPGSMRSGGNIQHLPAPAKNVRVKLELELAKSDYKKYQTQLFRENEALGSQEELKTEPRNAHYIVPVTITGEILTPGDYQLKLSGVGDSGKAAFIDSYTFRVTHDRSADPEPDRGSLAR
jgi:anti-sigma factor RsiW